MSASSMLQACTLRTMYFIGVTTKQSSIMNVFPRWSEILGLDAQIVGYDCPLHAPAEDYLTIVRHIKHDPLAIGALVTTHKLDLLHATRAEFDYLDPYAALCDEISSISKRGGQLRGHAKDPISSGKAWEALVPRGHWAATQAEVLCLGAGGSATAISVYAASIPTDADRPRKMTFVDRSQERLDTLRTLHQQMQSKIDFDYRLHVEASENDRLLEKLPAGSLVINATGMGKDRPGSPLTDQAQWPDQGFVWELNYRGALDFLHQARRQAEDARLTIADGWVYFLHGWTQVIAEVFDVQLTPELFQRLDSAASELRPA